MGNRTWADEALEKLQVGQSSVERDLAEDRLRLHQAPYVWQEFRDWVQENCEELNAKASRKVLAFEVMPVTKLRVRRLDEQLRVRATLNAELDLDATDLAIIQVAIDYQLGLARLSAAPYRLSAALLHFRITEFGGVGPW